MERDDVCRILRQYQEELRTKYGVRSLLVFGSVARNEAVERSDVDLLVDFTLPPGFDGYMDLKFRLEELLGCRVDLVMRKALKPYAVPMVEREAIRVA
jgi:predicted nucleotidyltransferase